MGLLKLLAIATALCAAVMAYLMYTPIPTGYTDQLYIRYHMGATQLATTLAAAAKSFDFSEHNVIRSTLRIMNLPIAHTPRKTCCSNISINATTIGEVPVTVFKPEDDEYVNRAILFFHGDWMSENPDNYAYVCESLAIELNALVIRVEYRMPPIHIYPAAVEDASNLASYFMQHVADYGVHPARVALMGDGFGAGLAAAVSQYLKQNKVKPFPKLQILINPILQAIDFDTPSYQYHKTATINKRQIARLYSQYVFGNDSYTDLLLAKNHTRKVFKSLMMDTFLQIDSLPEDDILNNHVQPETHTAIDEHFMKTHSLMFEQHVMLSPILSSDEPLKSSPATWIYTCQQDAARDDGYFYARRLQEVGNKVTHVNFDVCYSNWLEAVHLSQTNKEHFEDIMDVIDKKL